MKFRTLTTRMVAAATAGVLVATGLVAGVAAPAAAALLPGPAPIEQRNSATVTADPLPTVQIDSGIVWAQVIRGDTVYAGGSFSNARPAGAAAGTNLMPRSNILAYNINTGVATSFAPQINGTVKSLALSPDGSTLYVGGSFNQVNGLTRYNLAAFSTATGALLSFNPAIGGSYVNAIVATTNAVYVGGLIGAARGVTRKNLAAMTPSGALLGWAPTTDYQVDSMVLEPGGKKLIVGGRFYLVNDVVQRGMAALDLTSGAILPWEAPATVRNGWNEGTRAGKTGIMGLGTDEDGVYGTGWGYSITTTEGNLEGVFAAEAGSGAIRWVADCHGDHYSVYSDGTNVYSTSHEHACESAGGLPQAYPAPGNMRHATVYTAAAKGTLSRTPYVTGPYADWSGTPAPAAVNWFPEWTTGTASGSGQAGWTITGNGKYLLVGGEFPFVNGQRSQGIARFAVAPASGAKQGPRLSGASWVPHAESVGAGTARVTIPANSDRDDLELTYELRAEGVAAPVATVVERAPFWNKPIVTMTVKGLPAGSTQTYRVIARDKDGNSATSESVSVTVSDVAAPTYVERVLDDGPSLYWRLGSNVEEDLAGANDAVIATGVSTVNDSAIAGQTGSASFNGGTNGLLRSTNTVPARQSYALELWFNTTTTTGGKIIGYGDRTTGSSAKDDRHVYMRNNGQLTFGVSPGITKTITSPKSYRDGAWHHVVAQQSIDGGMELWVDGTRVASEPTVTMAQDYLGFWRVGGDSLGGWPGRPTSDYFKGRLDEVAVYTKMLTGDQISTHYAIGKGAATPTAAFTVSGANQSWSFDGRGSTAPTGSTITGYSWAFGDGGTSSGATASHTYSSPGTYEAKLTVTDDRGLTSTTSQTVTAVPPHAAPVAVIGSEVSGLSAAFDASGSTVSGGATLTGYAWTFGDGSSSTQAAPVKKYAAAGTYPVTLTVTDSTGASSKPATASVTVSHADPVAAFTSTTTGLQASVDGAASSASDGATLSYAWTFGDGSSATGATATRTYSTAGTYPVTLKVTDSMGASHSVTQQVTVASETFVARDDFERTLASGWGSAVVGGAWGTATGFQVAGGAGKITMGAGQTRSNLLNAVSAQDVDARVSFTSDKVADGGGLHFNYLVRKSTAGDYRAKLRIAATGAVTVSVAKVVGTTETLLVSRTLSGYTHTPGSKLHVRLEAVGSGTSTVRVKVWADGTAEPSGWLVSATDAQAELQRAGGVGVLTYMSGSTTNAPVTVSVDDLTVR